MDSTKLTNDDLRLIGSVLQRAIVEVGVTHISCSASSRRLFEMVANGERDFEVLKAAVLDTNNVFPLTPALDATPKVAR